jgi:hypothetical protein
MYTDEDDIGDAFELVDGKVPTKQIRSTNVAGENGFPYRPSHLLLFMYQFLSGVRLLAITVEHTVGNLKPYADPTRRQPNTLSVPAAASDVPSCTVRELLLALAESRPHDPDRFKPLVLPCKICT